MVASSRTVKLRTGTPTDTAVAPLKPRPLMRMVIPPVAGPLIGETDVMGGPLTVKLCAAVYPRSHRHTMSGPICAQAGTTAERLPSGFAGAGTRDAAPKQPVNCTLLVVPGS